MSDNFLPLETRQFSEKTGNMYKSVNIMGKRANQITIGIKEELTRKLAEFAPAHDNLEEIIENREQIEISKYYERKAKPTKEAVISFLNDGIYYRSNLDPDDTNAPDAPDA